MSKHRLITFLGRSPRRTDGYQRTRYVFPDQQPSAEVAFFGWALLERLRPSHAVVLGTAGSMWDYLASELIEIGTEPAPDWYTALRASVESDTVSQSMLEPLAEQLSAKHQCVISLRLIPYGRTAGEQFELLRAIDQAVEPGDLLEMDITHGFRHLPMLALVAAQYLEMVRNVELKALWYGAYDPDTGVATVHDLAGLNTMLDDLRGLGIYDRTGDLRALLPTLKRNGLPDTAAEQIERAAHLENIFQSGPAKKALTRASAGLESVRSLAAPSLILPLIEQRVEETRDLRLEDRQLLAAERALAAGDLLRTALCAYECAVTRMTIARGMDAALPEARDQARELYLKNRQHPGLIHFDRLRRIRNATAHGKQVVNSADDAQFTDMLRDPQRLCAELTELCALIRRGALP